ncbi:putative cytochrome P450 hydroxylase [Alloactinosynnema sp. L-07]|uniref:cytochrome P450 n=1 Tax=Alloactinosynnema sp. L-07 TaxID=1653480 RepID=UPI00065EFED2|nr:cytochrome P450 [Alloactinosynnema sp. L-07]CRK60211.1 putative cytochrome P450 hydroxylase [Alloactinosynnema sp. L-07]
MKIAEARVGTRLTVQRAVVWAVAASGDQLARLAAAPWRDDPYSIYERLRSGPPITRSRFGWYAVTGHDLCSRILRDRRFHVRSVDGVEPQVLTEPLIPADYAVTPTFLELDAPDHTRLRALARPAFSPSKIEGYRATVTKTTNELLDRALAKPEFDLMTDFAAPLPIAVISELLGIPEVDADRFAEYGRALGAALDGVTSLRQARALRAATMELRALFGDLIQERSREPGPDVISALVSAMGTGKLTELELLTTCELLLIAGFETTANLIGNGMWAFARHPDQWERLRADPELAPGAVEEILRFESPVQMTQRMPHEEVEIEGVHLPTDSIVVLLLGAAGRDPAVFSDPDRFDIGRPDTDHLAFSSGVHYCLGAPLARLEADIALRALADRLPTVRPLATPEWRGTTVIRGLKSLRLRP